MKQITITTGKCTLLVKELPVGAEDPDYFNNILGNYIHYRVHGKDVLIDLDFAVDMLGGYHEITEWTASTVVANSRDNERTRFLDYKTMWYEEITALESLDSLMEANEVHFENPLGEHPCESIRETGVASTYCYDYCQGLCSDDVDFDDDEWQEAQSKVWDKERTYLFIKTN